MATKKITEVSEVNSIKDTDKLFINDGENIKQVAYSKTGVNKNTQTISTLTNEVKKELSTKPTTTTTLSDSSNGVIRNLKVYGKSEQAKYSGVNLLNPTLTPSTYNGIVVTKNSNDNSYTFNGTATETTWLQIKNFSDIDLSKTYRLVGCPTNIPSNCYLYDNAYSDSYRDTGSGYSGKFVNQPNIWFRINNGTTVTNLLIKPMLVNITDNPTWSSCTYADFEPYTGGKPSPSPQYPQTIHSVVEPSVECVGKNLWDEEWEVGYINTSNGNDTSANDAIRNVGYISVYPNTDYYITSEKLNNSSNKIRVYFYKNSTFISCNSVDNLHSGNSYSKGIFTTPNECNMIRISFGNLTNVSSFVNDIAIIKGTSGTYQPYKSAKATLSNITLNAIPNTTIKDVFDVEKKGVWRYVGVVDLGDLSWTYSSSFNGCFSVGLVGYKNNDGEMCCEKYVIVKNGSEFSDKNIYGRNNGITIFAKDTTYTDATTFKNAVKGTLLYYELATPTFEQLTDSQVADFLKLQTQYPITNVSVTSEDLDGECEFEYSTHNVGSISLGNAYAIEKLFDLLFSLKDKTNNVLCENWNKTKTYAVGNYVLYDGSLWKCKIQHYGQTPKENTYWTKTTICNELLYLKSLI